MVRVWYGEREGALDGQVIGAAITYELPFKVVLPIAKPAERSRFNVSQTLPLRCKSAQHGSVRIIMDAEDSSLSKLAKVSAIRIVRILAEHLIQPRLERWRSISLNVQEIGIALGRHHREGAVPLPLGLQSVQHLRYKTGSEDLAQSTSRPYFEEILWVLGSGARWKDVPAEYPSYSSAPVVID